MHEFFQVVIMHKGCLWVCMHGLFNVTVLPVHFSLNS